MIERDTQQARAGALNLHVLLAHWGDVAGEAWVSALLTSWLADAVEIESKTTAFSSPGPGRYGIFASCWPILPVPPDPRSPLRRRCI